MRNVKTIPLTMVSNGVRLNVKVVPGASRDRVMGALGDALKVAVSKPPSGGEANKAVVSVIAKALALKPAQVQIIAGHSNPRKQLLITGATVADLSARLEPLL